MINFTSILTAIKGASLATKIGLGIGTVAVVAGGTAGTVAIINANQPKEPEIVASNSDTDNSPSEQKGTQTEETKTEDQKTERSDNEQKPTTNNSQTTTKPNSNNSTSSNNSSASKPHTSSTGTSTTQPSQPSQPAQPTKKPDYNLNDRYVAGYVTMAFSKQNDAGEWYVAETKEFFGVAKFTGSTADLTIAVMPQYIAYAEAHGYPHDGGMGAVGLTWDDVVRNGTALNEAKCTQYGLSCGRW